LPFIIAIQPFELFTRTSSANKLAIDCVTFNNIRLRNHLKQFNIIKHDKCEVPLHIPVGN